MHRGIAQSLNPEAGWHSVTTDRRELEAIARAHERSWNEFPYYEARFGDRGKRFSVSDSAWLATLSSRPLRDVLDQVRWLGGVLSSRGMPQILLERHLTILHEELGHNHLKRAANDLASRQRSVFPQKRFDQHARDFEEHVSGFAPFTGMGILLASAVADERLGIEHAVSAISDWATDRARFPVQWIEAVNTSLTAMRER